MFDWLKPQEPSSTTSKTTSTWGDWSWWKGKQEPSLQETLASTHKELVKQIGDISEYAFEEMKKRNEAISSILSKYDFNPEQFSADIESMQKKDISEFRSRTGTTYSGLTERDLLQAAGQRRLLTHQAALEGLKGLSGLPSGMAELLSSVSPALQAVQAPWLVYQDTLQGFANG